MYIKWKRADIAKRIRETISQKIGAIVGSQEADRNTLKLESQVG